MNALKKKIFFLLGTLAALSLTSCDQPPSKVSKKCRRGTHNQSCRPPNPCYCKRKTIFDGRSKKNSKKNSCCCDGGDGGNSTCFTQSCRTGTYTSD